MMTCPQCGRRIFCGWNASGFCSPDCALAYAEEMERIELQARPWYLRIWQFLKARVGK